MKRHFEEYLKRVFSDDESQDVFHCPVNGLEDDPKAGIEDGFLAISRADMKRIFDPVIVDVVKLVHEQVQKVEAIGQKVSVRYPHSLPSVEPVLNGKQAVLLVGGFGASEYLRKCLKQVCDLKGIPLMNPVNA